MATRTTTPAPERADAVSEAAAPAGGVPSGERAEFKLSPDNRRVFIGLMLGMLVASVSQTIVGPAMPRIVAELGGMEHYSWIATAAMLVSAISVPIVGKLSDLYGRRAFFLGGTLVFMVGSVIAGFSTNFWMLVAARAVQGVGMGTLMPLSQTIIGDIIPPRQRGKYQGLMGSIFGLTSVAGPLAGGFITDNWGWRWLFFVSLPIGVAAFAVIFRFLHIPHERREAKIDTWGIATLTVSLVLILLATSFGGSTYAWDSTEIRLMYAVGAVFLALFIWAETKAEEPVLPLRLFRSSTFTLSVVSSFFVSMMMFGAIIYIPVFAQGVIGVSATNSGLILMPLMVSLVLLGILGGMIITRTGRYKELIVLGLLIMGGGYRLLTMLSAQSSDLDLTVAMAVLGIGLGMCMQVFTLVVQNVVQRQDLGVATASVQFFRNVGSTVGIAIFGSILTSRMHDAILSHLPAGAASHMPAGSVSAGSVLDPSALAKLPPFVATAVREGLADSLHDVFLAGLPMAVVALLAALFIKAVPLRDTIHTPAEQGKEMLDTMAHSSQGDILPLGMERGRTRTNERLLGLEINRLLANAEKPGHDLMRRAVADIGGGDFYRGVALLSRTAVMLTTEDEETAARAEKYAAEVADRGRRHGGALEPATRADIVTAITDVDTGTVMTGEEPTVSARHERVDVDLLRTVTSDLVAAMLADDRRLQTDARV